MQELLRCLEGVAQPVPRKVKMPSRGEGGGMGMRGGAAEEEEEVEVEEEEEEEQTEGLESHHRQAANHRDYHFSSF